MAQTTTLRHEDLTQFIGTENWYQHWALKTCCYTDGVKYMAEHAGAYWLIDEIMFAQRSHAGVLRKHWEFQSWTLMRDKEDSSAQLVCTDGNDNWLYSKFIDFTDFPLDEITLYFIAGTLLLTSEY